MNSETVIQSHVDRCASLGLLMARAAHVNGNKPYLFHITTPRGYTSEPMTLREVGIFMAAFEQGSIR
jgi:hypothetical protein